MLGKSEGARDETSSPAIALGKVPGHTIPAHVRPEIDHPALQGFCCELARLPSDSSRFTLKDG